MGTPTLTAEGAREPLPNDVRAWRKTFGFLLKLTFISLIALLAYLAQLNRTEAIWTAENGWGYGFGITGGVLMLLLLVYPLSKHWKPLTRHLSVKFWFKLHMAFGLLGPVLIFMHSSYQLGSMNSRVAFFCMLIVATSGLFGRYFYSRIHHGLYGKKATFESLRADSVELNKQLGPIFELKPKFKGLLRDHETRALEIPSGLHRILFHWLVTRLRAARLYPTLARGLDAKLLAMAQQKGWEHQELKLNRHYLHETLILHKKLIRQTQELHFYERLFAVWHLLHLPLFMMLIITGFVHVYAVHAY
jgi:hypothetical protein